MPEETSGKNSGAKVISKDDILAKLHQLPTLTIVVQEVIASFKSENPDGYALAYKIAQDHGLSAKILRVANSSFYGLQRKVGSIQEASLLIGLNSIRTLALSAGFMLAFPPKQINLFDRRAYWLHSFRVAGYTQALAKCLGHDQQLAFTIGMFHDIGQLVLDVCIPERFANILERQNTTGANLIDLEQAELGFDHADVGAEMVRRWNFPPAIEHAVRHWRMPEHEPFEQITGLVHVAVLLESGLRGDQLMNRLPASLCDRLQLDLELIEAEIPPAKQLDADIHQILDI